MAIPDRKFLLRISSQLEVLQTNLHNLRFEVDQYLESRSQKALLFGLNYPGTEYQLNGCVNDVELVAQTLSEFGFNQIQTAIDSDLIGDLDVLDYLKLEIATLDEGDRLWVHYSGHGLQVWDQNGDENDGLDEAIFTHRGPVTDDQIAEVLAQIPSGVEVVCVFDCCNSGTICDLPYSYLKGQVNESSGKKSFPSTIVLISGCQDDQTSADTWIQERQQHYGALTSTLVECLDQEITWKELIDQVQTKLKTKGYTQIPQLSTNQITILDETI